MRTGMLRVGLFSLLLASVIFNACGGDLKITMTDSGITFTADPVTLTWNTPTTYTDLSPATVAGYRVYYGGASKSYSGVSDTKANTITLDTTSLFSGISATYFFAVTAYDATGRESDFSNELSTYVSFRQIQ